MSDIPVSDPAPVDAQPVLVPASATEPVPDGDTSILASIRQKREKLGAGSTPVTLDIPGYDGELLARYKWVPLRTLTRTAQQLSAMSEPTEQSINAAADSLVATCQEILIRVGDVVKPLAKDSLPITFGDPRLAEALGFQHQSEARENCKQVFRNEYAVIAQGAQVVEWLQDTTRKVDGQALGNS